MAQHPNIERVNQILASVELGLPAHRRRIDASGHNVPFLRKILPKNEAAPQELKDLMALKDKELMKVA
jgi:hypothetical protein